MSPKTFLILVLALGLLLNSGCGGSGNPARAGERELTVGYVGWDDSVAVSNLTRTVLEDELNYDVRLRRFDDPKTAVLAAAEGEIDTFQNVWMPDHGGYLGEAEGEKLLSPWLIGMTRSGLAAPGYMDVGSIEGMTRFEKAPIIAVEPGVKPGSKVSETVADRMPDREISYLDTSEMLSEVDRLYRGKKPFFFTTWSPHWTNRKYEFEYLVDPEDELSEATQPSRIQPVVRGEFGEEDPLAFALVDTLQLSDHQVSGLELSIRNAKSPRQGVDAWLQDREWLAQSWIGAAKRQAGED
jgi:glycine betaine/proline transport system substrate-binding protein